MATSYRYEPLQSEDSFRVLVVRGSSDEQAQVYCRLVEVRLSERRAYAAISYAWGDQLPSRDIIVQGGVLRVTKNCESALRGLRPKEETAFGILWIDAVCIDQSESNLKERYQQLGIMGRIYSGAANVMVWLDSSGPNDRSEYSLAAEWLSQFAQTSEILDEKERKDTVTALVRNADSNGM